MLNPCYVHGTTHVHGYVHACSCMFVHVKFWLPRSSWALVSHTREGALAHTHSPTVHPHSLSRLKPWPTEDSSTPFFHYHLFNFIQLLSQCTKELREEVLRFPASLWWRTRCLYIIIDKGARLQFTPISPWTLCLLDYISCCSKISFTILHRAFRLLRLDSKDQS